MIQAIVKSIRARHWNLAVTALALVASALAAPAAHAQRFPSIPVWAFPGGWRDSSRIEPRRCVGSFTAGLPDSIEERARTLTVRFLRDRQAEARPDFAGYRIYRAVNAPDTSRMVLVRRFSLNDSQGRNLTWNFSRLNPATMQYECAGRVVHDSIVTFVDADSNGNYVKGCRRLDQFGRCISPGDSIFRLVAPPGPHDGFLTYYAITYEALNTTDNQFTDLFVPDSSGNRVRCPGGVLANCPNLNSKSRNITSGVEPTAGPTPNLERVHVVPNPFVASEVWDQPGGREIHFINLPRRAVIKIYTLSGDLVANLKHDDTVRDFARWNLKNDSGRDIASGIYLYRIEAASFAFQDRFIVIR